MSKTKVDAWVRRVFNNNLERLFPGTSSDDEWNSELGKLFRSGWHGGRQAEQKRSKPELDDEQKS